MNSECITRGSIDFVINNMGFKNNACFLPLPLINGGGKGG